MRPLTLPAPRRGAAEVPNGSRAAGGETTGKKAILWVALAFVTVAVAFAPMARADHLFAAAIVDPPIFFLPMPAGGRIGLLPACFGLMTDLDWTANTGFFVAHGWVEPYWDTLTAAEKRAFASEATRFVLLIDGVAQPSALHAAVVNQPDGMFNYRVWVSESHDGLSGDHVFEGQWYFDASNPAIGGDFGQSVLLQDCSLNVHFVL